MYTTTQSWVSMIRNVTRLVAVLSCVAFAFSAFVPVASAATGVPRIMNYQGRLMNSSGTLLGGSSGTDYCVKFSLYDDAAVGGADTKLWPASAPSTMTVTVRNGIFNAGVGDTNAGGDTLDFNFEDNDAAYLNVEVASKVGATCASGDGAESFENLSPRQRVSASGYAINSATLGGKNGAYYLANSFSTTSATVFTNSFAHSSTTIPKTYTNNTFIGVNTFADITVVSATSTNLSVGGTFSGAGLTSCSGTNDKLVWNAATRQFGCDTDLTGSGSGGSDGNWTFFNNAGIRPATTSNQVLVGGTATTSLAKFEAQGGAKFDNATSTTLNTTVFGLGGLEYFTSLAGAGLQNVGGVLTLNSSGDWTGTFDGHEGAYYLANSFSTSSAAYFASAGLAFSTTSAQYFASQNPAAFATSSADYWKTQNNFHSTSSFAYDLSTYNSGYFFSTTSVAYWDSTQFRWATTSSDAWLATKSTSNLPEGTNLYYTPSRVAGVIAGTTTDALAEGATNQYFTPNRVAAVIAGTTTDALAEGASNKYFTVGNADSYLNGKDKGYFFSTTSALYFNSQVPATPFATSSADYWQSQRNFHSTSSFAYNLSTYDTGYFFSTTSVAFWDSTQFRWATTSSDAWLATKSTTDLAEGSNLYYTPSRVAGVIAGTTTDALAEGSVNQYYTPTRDIRFSTSSALFFSANGLAFSTTSTDYWKSVNNFFSTTSASHFSSLGLAFSTTSASYFLEQNLGAAFSTSSTNYYVQTSSTIPTTYKNNTFTGTNDFQNVTATGVTSTASFAATASSSNLFSNIANIGSLVVSAFTGDVVTATNATTTNFYTQNASTSNINANTASVGSASVGALSLGSALSGSNGGTGLSSVVQNALLIGGPGNSWTQISTSSLGLATYGDLGAYLGLAAWYATTTDALSEGSNNKYFTPNRVATVLAGTTTDAIAEGVTNKYFNTTNADAYLNAKDKGYFFSTTSASAFLSLNQGNAFSTSSAAYNLSTYDKGYFFSTTSVAYWDSLQFRWATTSSDAWLATKSTTDLAEGSNLFYTPNRVAGVIAGTTTDALAEGTTNKYFNNVNADSYLNAKDKGYFFSTTSASAFAATGLAFSTTSTDYWKSVNNFFSTTSASHFSSLGLAFSTTSASYFLGQNLGNAFSTTSADYFVHSSSTIPKTYTNNTFIGVNSFANITMVNATSSTLFSNLITSLSGAFGSFSATSSNATSTIAGSLVVGTSTGSYKVSVMGDTTGPTSATGTAIFAITNNNNTLSSANNVLRLNLRTPYGTACVTGTTCPRFEEYFTGVASGSDTGGRSVGSLRLSTAGTGITQTSGAADFAEFMQLSESAAVGDIVSLNSSGQYRKAVAGESLIGVVSDNPAFVGNAGLEGQPNAYIVGFAGVIRTTVSTANGPINAGDLIAASNVPGVGIKLSKSGYALGQALESYSGVGNGTISILVLPKFVDAAVALESYGGGASGASGYWDLSTSTNTVSLASSTYSVSIGTSASTSNLVVSNGFTFGKATGVLKSIAGVVTSSLLNLANDVTGVLGISNGGTGTSTAPSNGQVLVGNSSGGYDLVAASALVSQNQGSAYSTSSAAYNLSTYDKSYFFSTTSTDYWKSQNNFFSTSSTDFWKTQNNFFSTTSASYFSSLGLSFSTSSASAFLNLNQGAAFSTSSASAFLAQNQGNAFSTTSANYYTSQNQGSSFSTTSVNAYMQASTTVPTTYKNNSFSGTNSFQSITAAGATTTSLSTGSASTTNLTISALQNSMLYTGPGGVVQSVSVTGPIQFSGGTLSILTASAAQSGALSAADWIMFNSRLSSTTADQYIHASSTIPKTYTTNTFIGINNFANITATGATTTSLFSTTASSTNVFANAARFGSIGSFSLTGAVAAAANDITGINVASTTNLWISSIRNGLLATNGQGQVVASSTPTAASFNATSNTVASQLPYASSTAISVLQQLSIGAANGTILQGSVNGTSTVAGVINVTGTNSTSTFSGGVSASRLNITGNSTSTSAWGMSIQNGCFAINGNCTLASVTAANSSLTVTPGAGTATIALNLSNPNIWTGLQTFGSATSSVFEATQFYARTIQSTSTNALVLKSNFSSTAGLTFGSTSTPNVLGIDTINNRVTVGTGLSNTSLLVLDAKNTGGDPSATVDGSMYFNSNVGSFRCYNGGWVTCGGEAASSTGNVQYKNVDGSFTANAGFTWSIPSAGLVLSAASSTQTTDLLSIASSSGRTMFGVSGSGILTLASTTDPTAPANGELNVYAKEIAGRMLPKWVGPSGVDTPFQANLGFNRIAMVVPNNATTSGMGVTTAFQGTNTAGALSTATLKQSIRRLTMTSAAGAGSLTGLRSTATLATRGNAAGIGGYFMTMRFGLTTMQAGQRGFFGMSDSIAAATNVDPTTSTVIGKVGMGFNLNSGNWKFMWNVAGTAPSVYDLGASFPLNTTDLYELIIFVKPNDTVMSYRITNLSTGAQVSSTTASTNIPGNTTYVAPMQWMTNNGTAAAVAFDTAGWYLESDN